MDKSKTTARVIVTYKCNRSCPGCCNTHENSVRKIEDINELLKYDEIVITGGEPMLIKEKLFHFLLQLRNMEYNGKIYMYTAFWNHGIYSHEILDTLDGITFTIHAEATKQDIVSFKQLSNIIGFKPHLNSRLFIDSRLFTHPEALQRRVSMWDENRKLEWKDECKPAEHEELVEFLL